MPIKVGSKAPDFTLKSKSDSGLVDVKLSANFGQKNTVLLFFPAAFTGVCTKELCDITAGLGQYANFVLNQSAIGEQTFRHSTLEPPYNRWRPDAGFYLKLHGSIDWFYCQNTACRAFGSVFPWLDLRESACCAECHERLDVLIVPPVLNKDYRKHAFVRRVWNVAALEIATASMLIVWGYSLPPTDFHSMWLFRQARKALLQNLVLINPLVDDPNYVLRFREIFRGKDAKISLYKSYEDFAKAHPVEKA